MTESEKGARPEDEATRAAWERHYDRPRARQAYPDENLVRLLRAVEPGPALDLGCGSGRHLRLLQDLDFAPLYGADLSRNSLAICRELCPGARLLEVAGDRDATGSRFRLPPIANGSLQVVVVWGVFHYNSEATIQAMLTEICRMLRPDGLCLGTLRAVGDTHFHDNPDMAGATLRLFDESGTRELLGAHFGEVQLGYAERSPVGELGRRVCHWIFRAGQRGAARESRASL